MTAPPAIAREMPSNWDRATEREYGLLCASGSTEVARWTTVGPRYFSAGIAMLMASTMDADRAAYLALSRALWPGMSKLQEFEAWVRLSPAKPSSFLPRVRALRFVSQNRPPRPPSFSTAAQPAFLGALQAMVERIERSLRSAPAESVRMVVAGGAAQHAHTGLGLSEDVDAVFFRRIMLPADLDVAYPGSDGYPRLLYLDRQFKSGFSLMHPQAFADAPALDFPGLARDFLDVRVLSPLDLAVSKTTRMHEADGVDLRALAATQLITSEAYRERALEALDEYVGDIERVRFEIDAICATLQDAAAPRPR